METDGQKLQRLKQVAGNRGFDIIQAPLDDIEPDRVWRVIEALQSTRSRPQIVFGGPMQGWGATLDEIEAYLDKL
jgi:hypothetical protein